MTPEYRDFLARKAPRALASGMKSPPAMHAKMKPHQRDATEFCLRQGRAGLFLDTGLGKTFCELEFAKYTAAETNGRALILTPLAVAKQIEREAKRLGYLTLWSNPGDVVLSPFMGIGSEGVQTLRDRRKFVGIELKESYFRQAVKYLQDADAYGDDLFTRAAE